MMEGKSVLKEKSLQFAVRIAKFYKILIERNKEFVLSKQLLRSGTSIGANIREAQNAASDKDFINKLQIAQKEADETIYWLEVMFYAQYISEAEFVELKSNSEELLRMLRSSILTKKKNINT